MSACWVRLFPPWFALAQYAGTIGRAAVIAVACPGLRVSALQKHPRRDVKPLDQGLHLAHVERALAVDHFRDNPL